MRRSPLTAALAVNKLAVDSPCFDPISALEVLRRSIGPQEPSLRMRGTVGTGQFELRVELTGEEPLEVPAGRFQALRLNCQVAALPSPGQARQTEPHTFTLWLSRDERRLPLCAEISTALGDFTVKATEIG